jgi:diadenosine tetraphosphate (Ap4A) HIT family hydrolase
MKKKVPIFLTLALLAYGLSFVDFKIFTTAYSGCAFCKEEVLSVQTFDRQEGVMALLTHKPSTRGHLLIVPERHVERFEDLTAEEMLAIGRMIQKVDKKAKEVFGNTGYILLQKNGREAGQSVPHVHFHYIPKNRKESGFLFIVRFFLSHWLKPMSALEMQKAVSELSS